MSPKIHCYTGARTTSDPGCNRSTPSVFFTYLKQVTVIIIVLAFLFGFWFGVSTHHAPRASYPYYDTQEPVPPWNEPAPLEGNHNSGGDYK